MRFFHSGCYERTKAAAHVGLGVIAGVCCVYNVAAFLVRGRTSPRRHLAVNAVLYGALAALEVRQVQHHCARGRDA